MPKFLENHAHVTGLHDHCIVVCVVVVVLPCEMTLTINIFLVELLFQVIIEMSML